MRREVAFLLFLPILWALPVQAYPDGGRKVCQYTSICTGNQALLNGGLIFVKLDFNGIAKGVKVTVRVRKGQAKGACQVICTEYDIEPQPDIIKGQWIVLDTHSPEKICGPTPMADEFAYPPTQNRTTQSITMISSSRTSAAPSSIPSISQPLSARRQKEASPSSIDTIWDSVDSNALYEVEMDDIYSVTVAVSGDEKTKLPLMSISITLKNPYGYLDAADYPAMVFYAVMLVVYVFLAVVWGALLCCYFKDLIRLQVMATIQHCKQLTVYKQLLLNILREARKQDSRSEIQFFIAVAILLGVLEKTFYVAEYAVVNAEGVPSNGYFPEYLVVTEAVSALKQTFGRILFILVSLGYGTVIPRLGPLLKWLMLFGFAFFLTAFTDGVVRATYYVTRDGLPASVLGAFIPRLVLDSIFIYWICSAIINTQRKLRLLQNRRIFSLYKHLLYAFVFAVIGIAAFCLWFYFSGFIERCEDLHILWLKEGYWHTIFTALLIILMILWRPSSNAVRCVHMLVPDADEEEVQQATNRNLETMSMREESKEDGAAPPRPSHDTEQDLKWVEENLPTSTLDKVLQPLADCR